jgi:Zn ribbon nucleic-acid-binding protein
MNTNILEGVRCPQCGNEDEFRIEALVVCTVTDDSAEATGDLEWTDESWCLCPRCEHAAKLAEFRVPEEN